MKLLEPAVPVAEGTEARSGRSLIVGLGNPGPRYSGNRHNVGIRCLDQLARVHRIDIDRRRNRVAFGLGDIEHRKVILAQPRAFMNASGRSVAPLVRFYQVPLRQLLIVYDDLDLPLGSIRLRPSGGSGGHKGMSSVIQCLGEQKAFPRLRIGIGRPPGKMDPAAYVLRNFTPDELPCVEEALDRAVSAIALWLRDGIDAAMNEYN
jgi:PTH1 family peptidyl-tRNA hydrolase